MRCAEFYEKCQREGPEWCQKTPRSVEFITNYIELAGMFAEMGVPKKRMFIRLSEWAAHPLFEKANASLKDKAIEVIAASLRNEDKKWTLGDVKRLFLSMRRQQRVHERSIDCVHGVKPIIRLGDFRKLINDVPDESVDCVLTDPPYGSDDIPLWVDLSRECARVLKPSRFFISYCGWMFLPEVLQHLQSHLSYYWTIPLKLNGHHCRVFQRHIFQETKPILIFQKPPVKPMNEWTPDLITFDEPDKDMHDWGQGLPAFKFLLEQFTYEGETVLDPMMGGGVVVEACVETKRHAIAFDIDPKAYDMVVKRLGEVATT